jgi:SAM-dependent methyltransferase
MRSASQELVRKHQVESWFDSTPWQRAYARDILSRASEIRDRSLPVHDIGCGIAQMLVVLGKNGFTELSGCDREEAYVAAARELCARFHVHAGIQVMDGAAYVRTIPTESAGLILALNWLYHLDAAATREFLTTARRGLRHDNGCLVMDIIRSDYDPPVSEKKDYESSYAHKWLPVAFEECVASAGLQVGLRRAGYEWGRVVYWLQNARTTAKGEA